MDILKNKEQEGKETDGLGVTSSPEVLQGVELNSSPTPTPEQKETLLGVDESEVENENEISETPENVEGQVESVEENTTTTPLGGDGEEKLEKMFTQSQVNDMIGNTRAETREKTFRYIYGRYGVNSEEELDAMIGNAQRFDSLKEKFDTERTAWKDHDTERDKELSEIKEQVALMQSGIDSQRYEDAKLILKGKGLEVSLDNITKELATHPEWRKLDEPQQPQEQEPQNFVKVREGEKSAEPVSRISVLGNEGSPRNENAEEDYVLNKLFKV